jgi:hypothetical protein
MSSNPQGIGNCSHESRDFLMLLNFLRAGVLGEGVVFH